MNTIKKKLTLYIVAMSFLHLANTLHSIHAKHVNNLAYRKFKALDVPDQALPTPAEEANTVKLAETLDRAVNMQGNLVDIYMKLDTPTVFRDVKVKPLTLSDITVKLGPGNKLLAEAADAKSLTQFEEKYKENMDKHYAWINEPSQPQLKIRPKVRPKWSPPEYPYHKYFLPSFQDMLKSLLKEKAERDKHGNPAWNMDRSDNHLAIVRRIFEGDIYASDAITDLIVEPVRVSCFERDKKKGGNLPSQKEVWEKLVADAKAGGESIPTNPKAAHEMVYGIARGCNLFNITLGIYLLTGEKNNKSWAPIDELNGAPGDVLDPAAGWGDRLGAAFITGAKSYRGWDTNDKLQPVYDELGKEYSSFGLNLDWKIECAPFETADLKGAMFDTVITSPPFFDKEIYEGETTSTTVHRGKAGWIKNYYHPMLTKAGGSLRPGGRFIAYISDGWMETSAKEILEGQLKMEYVGRVGYVQAVLNAKPDAGRVRNAFIWRVPKAAAAPLPPLPLTAALTDSTLTSTSTTALTSTSTSTVNVSLNDYYGPSVYLRLMRAMDGASRAAGGYNIPDLLDLVKFHKPDLMPKRANRENLLEILRAIREDIRLGPPVPETPRIPETTETPEPEPSVQSTSGVTLVPLHRDHFTALRKIQTESKLSMGEGIAGRGVAPTLEKALTLGYNTVFNNNEIIGFIGKYEIPAMDQDVRFVRNLTKSTVLKPGWLVNDAPLPEGATHVLHGFMNTDDGALIAKVFDQASFKHTLYDVDNGKNSKIMTSLGFSDTITDSSIPTWKWHWYEYLPKDSTSSGESRAKSDRVSGRVRSLKALLPVSTKIGAYLDVGGGDASITVAIGKEYSISADNVVTNDIFAPEGFKQPDPAYPIRYVQTKTDDKTGAVTIDLPDKTYDLVTCFVSMHHFEYMDLMLKEIMRVMKPGGYLFIREHDVQPDDTKLKDKLDQMHLEWDDYQIYVKETRLRLKKDDSFLPKINYMSRAGLRDMLKSHGLSFIGDRDYPGVVPVRKAQEYNYNFNYGTNWQHLYHALFKFASDTKEGTTEKSEKFKLEKLTDSHRAEVERLTSDVATMRTVGTGRPWDKRKLDDLFKYAKQDKDSLKTQYISYVIIYEGKIRGMLQFHPSSASNNDLAVNKVTMTDSRLYLTIFIHKDYQRRGLAERALRQAIDELRASRGNLIAFGAHIASTNTASLALHKKLNFKIEAVERIGLREFLALSLPPPLPDSAKGKFILSLENLMLPEHLEALQSRGLSEITLDDAVKLGGCEHVIMHGEMEGDKRLWRIATLLRSRVDAEVMTNKAWLSDVMKNVSINDSQLVLARSDRLKGVGSVPVFNDERGNPMAWIWRPEEDNKGPDGQVGWGGKGIKIGRGTDDLKALLAENKFKLTGLLTRFEERPMLLPWKLREFPYHPTYNATSANLDVEEMRKFHLRVYVLIVTDMHGKRMGLYKSGHLICFADKEYKENTLNDMDMNNTRFRGNNSKPFPEGWETTNGLTKDGLMGQLVELFRAVANKCMPRVKPYAESHYGYEILGCDVMVNSAGKAWIVEMNKKHGTGGNAPGTPGVLERISKNLYGGLFEYLDVPGSNSFITEVWSESEVKLPAAPKRSLEEKGASVAIVKEPRSAIAAYHSKIKYDVLKRIKEEGVPENPRILDLACGRGGDLFKYIDTFGKGTRIYGVDIDADAIAEAKKRVIARGGRNITLAVADVSKPELNTSAWGEPYDIIVCNFAAHYFFKSRETLSSFARIINRFSKKGTIVWVIMPEGIELVRLLIEKGKRLNTKVIIENETYNLSSDVSEMSKVGGKVDYKLHGTTYFQTAEPGANIITEGTSHEYFADINTLLEYMGITSEPPNDYRARYEVVDQSLFSRWGGRHGRDLTLNQREISFTNKSTILKRNEDQAARPMRDGKPVSDAELRAYWKPAEAKIRGEVPFERTSESDKRVLANLKI